MNRYRKLWLALAAILAASLAQAQIAGNRLMPPMINMTRQGWDVSLQAGNLTLGFPIGAVPGEVPVPVAFGLNATYIASAWVTRVYDPDLGKSVPVTNEIDRPMAGGIHFGYISDPATYSGTTVPGLTVLEDGYQIADSSWTAFSAHANLGSVLNLPQAYGFAAVSTSTAQADSTAAYLAYTSSAAALGSTYQTIVQGLAPSGFGSGNSAYKVVLDKNKARVYAYAAAVHAWVPVLWADRFGHYVTFQWVRSTTSLPSDITAITKVTVANQRSKGVVLRWADYASNALPVDILRLDFVGIKAPSVLVTGYPRYADVAPTAFVDTLSPDNQWTVVPSIVGSACRPTIIQVDAFDSLSQPGWSGSGSVAAIAPVASPADGTVAASSRKWTFAYDAHKAELASYTDDSRGLTTAFTYTNYAGLSRPRGVSQVDAVDLSLNKLSKRWTRTFPVGTSPLEVKLEGWWDPNLMVKPDRYHLITFPTDTLNYGNGVYQTDTLLDTAGKTWSTTTYAYSALGGGLDGALSSVQSVTVQQDGVPTITKAFGYPDSTKLQVTQQNVSATDAGGTVCQVSSTVNTYGTRWDMLEGHQLTQVVTTRYAPDGVTALGTTTQKNTWDAPASGPALLQLQKSYLDGGADGTVGQTATYDTEGRPKTQANVASFSTDAVATTTLTYGVDGYPSGATTAYTRPANQTGAASINQGATYDSAGRVLTQTDALGVKTTFTYDILSQVRTRTRQGETPVAYGYADPLTLTITQGGRTITELTDGFGRLVRRILPDGRKVEPTYDAYGRGVVQREFNTTGTASRASATSYDALDRSTFTSSPGGSSQTIAYSLSADGKQSIVATTVAGVNVSRKEYRNALGQVVKVEEPTGAITTMTYDGVGNLGTVTITDPANNTQLRSFKYNALGLLTEKTEPETGKQTFSGFNALGKPTTVTEASGTTEARVRTILYDGLGRVCKVSSSTGTDTVESFFDGAFLAGATGGGATPVTMSFAYKPATEGTRLATESTTLAGVTQTLAYAYLGTGQLDTISYPSGRIIGTSYDALGRVAGIQDRTGGGFKAIVASLSLDDWGQRQRLTFGSGAYSDWSTQDLGTHLKDWTIGYTTGGLGDPANPRAHAYDLAERLTKAGEWQGLTHDSANRLGSASAPSLGVAGITFNHDGFGNNTSQQMSGTSASSFNNFAFNALPTNQLPATTATGGLTGWAMNGRGEAFQIGTGTSSGQYLGLGWDALGRVKSLSTAGLAQSYAYAPSGLRIRVLDTATPANNRRYTYTSGGVLMSEYTDAGWKRDVVYLGSEAIAEIDAAGIHELHKDHLGTPRIITHGVTAQIEGKQAYGPYGEYLTGQATGYQPLTGYTGHLQNDPSGLIYMRGRFYSPAWHRFVNSDQGVDPNSWNQMAYVGGSPFMRVDPSGNAIVIITCNGNYLETTWAGSYTQAVSAAQAACRNAGYVAVDASYDPFSTVDASNSAIDPLGALGSNPLLGQNAQGGQVQPQTSQPKPPSPKQQQCVSGCNWKAGKDGGITVGLAAISLATGEGEVATLVSLAADAGGLLYSAFTYSGSGADKAGLGTGVLGFHADAIKLGVKSAGSWARGLGVVGIAVSGISAYKSREECIKNCMSQP